jgi:hypothetical protein
MALELEALAGFIEALGVKRSGFYLLGIKPPGWLVHGTDLNSAYDIQEHGFKYGEPNFAGLAYTVGESREQGYNFAIELEFFSNRTYLRYGNTIVLLRAPYVLTYHVGDEEPQAIFWGADATDIYVVHTNTPYGRKKDAFYIDIWDEPGERHSIYGDTIIDIVNMIENGEI